MTSSFLCFCEVSGLHERLEDHDFSSLRILNLSQIHVHRGHTEVSTGESTQDGAQEIAALST